VTNAELDEVLGTEGEWLFKHMGIKTRHWAQRQEVTLVVADKAAALAIEQAGVGLEPIDYLIAGTTTPDHQVAGIGPLIQAQLGLRHIPCLDIRTACCNPLYAFDIGLALLHAGRAHHMLIVGSEVQSKGLKLAPHAKEISSRDCAREDRLRHRMVGQYVVSVDPDRAASGLRPRSAAGGPSRALGDVRDGIRLGAALGKDD
jgi:acetyl-CoA acetyltransferase